MVLTAVLFFVAGLPDATAGDFAFSVGRDIGAVDFVGAAAITNVGTRLGYQTGKFQVFGTADFVRFRLNTEYASPDFDDARRSGGLYTLGVGGRYFFGRHADRTAIPYVIASGYALVPSASSDAAGTAESSAYGVGVMGGFGAEYFFAESFSIGGEIGVSGLFGVLRQDRTEWNGDIFQIYSGASLNFYL